MQLITTKEPVDELAIAFKVMLASGRIFTLKVSKNDLAQLDEKDMEELKNSLDYQKKEVTPTVDYKLFVPVIYQGKEIPFLLGVERGDVAENVAYTTPLDMDAYIRQN